MKVKMPKHCGNCLFFVRYVEAGSIEEACTHPSYIDDDLFSDMIYHEEATAEDVCRWVCDDFCCWTDGTGVGTPVEYDNVCDLWREDDCLLFDKTEVLLRSLTREHLLPRIQAFLSSDEYKRDAAKHYKNDPELRKKP